MYKLVIFEICNCFQKFVLAGKLLFSEELLRNSFKKIRIISEILQNMVLFEKKNVEFQKCI